MTLYAPELITIEQFAERFGVSRSTAFNWKKNGRLKPGRHYIQIGRTIKFLWEPDLLNKLHEDCLHKEQSTPVRKKRPRPRPVSITGGKPSIDLGY